MSEGLTFEAFNTVDGAFAVDGLDMRAHKGRSVVLVSVEGTAHYLKRFWLCWTQIFKRQVPRGHLELRMIDWLSDNGFAGPRIVRRGSDSIAALPRRVFFLMEEVQGELPLEATWRRSSKHADGLLTALASHAARLHDVGFCHTDFSERHILVGGQEDAWTFRLIDVERAHVGRVSPARAAADLVTLAASVIDETLRRQIKTTFLDDYIARRRSLPPGVDFRALFARATPTRSFS